MSVSRDTEIRRRMEDHFARRRPRRSRRSRLMTPLAVGLVAGVLAVTFFVGVLLAVASANPVSLSNVSAESMLNGALNAGISLVGGDAFKHDAAVADEPAATARPTAAAAKATPAPVDLTKLTGSPYSATSAVNAWRAAGFTVTQQPLLDAFRSLTGKSVGLRLDAPSGSLVVAVIVYAGPDAIRSDWQTAAGQRPQPRSDLALPSLETAWWNSNVVAAVLSRSGSPPSAFDAFFAMH